MAVVDDYLECLLPKQLLWCLLELIRPPLYWKREGQVRRDFVTVFRVYIIRKILIRGLTYTISSKSTENLDCGQIN